MAEHRRVVRGVPYGQSQRAGQLLEAGELVKVAEPAIHMDRADFTGRPDRGEGCDNAIDGLPLKQRYILTEVDSEVQRAVALVAGERGSWDSREYLSGERV